MLSQNIATLETKEYVKHVIDNNNNNNNIYLKSNIQSI